MKPVRNALAAAALLAVVVPAPAQAHGTAGHEDGAPAHAGETKSADVALRAATLTDHHGRPVRFPEEAVGGRIVVVSFVYTSCTTTCPITAALMAQVEAELAGVETGGEVRLLTISVDPVTDVPARMAAFAARFGAGPDWLWLTGDYRAVVDVLTGLDVYTPNFEEHPSVILVGDAQSGDWRRYFGVPSPNRLVDRIETLLAARQMTNPPGKENGS